MEYYNVSHLNLDNSKGESNQHTSFVVKEEVYFIDHKIRNTFYINLVIPILVKQWNIFMNLGNKSFHIPGCKTCP